MRKFINITQRLFESRLDEAVVVPETPYGYWIKPDGEFVVVPFQSHERVLIDATNGELRSYRQAYEAGWLRIVACKYSTLEDLPELTLQTFTGYISARAMVSLSALTRSQEFSPFRAELGSNWKRLVDPNSFMAFVKANRKLMPKPEEAPEEINEEELTEAVDVPYTDYGYWIDPKGEIIRVGYQAHERTLQRHTENRLKTYLPAYREGWVRVLYLPAQPGSDKRRLIIQSGLGLISARTMSAIAALARQPEVDTLFAEIVHDYKEFNEAQPFVAFVRQHRKPLPKPEDNSG